MNRVTLARLILVLIIAILTASAFIYNLKYYTAKQENLQLEYEYDSISNELFKYKRERAVGIILYNTSSFKSTLTMEESHRLDSVMFMLVDSSDIERIVESYNLKGSVWQNY